jgi:hypothetical protein
MTAPTMERIDTEGPMGAEIHSVGQHDLPRLPEEKCELYFIRALSTNSTGEC